ncbi:rhodanese-like domain-containing protein [Methanonatronarchaeum sp. AMET6-2]|uniref:MBL fold metallo-hydrolase n=1 Tax=Methanonatronarchaeum sp. AMET6-2 TaxID=2933293 RepID=UPI001FF3838B|nr:MBL fold metallo-hydrolase [Methanonatronarchaeum sp. AMET6-2]UOY10600.1 MBL fold metallo-hydrolase [Methanonatronarchaeum sp. AMET6-2]
MFFERVFSEGLAHYSYVFGDNGEAVVIDPRRDVSVYLDICMERDAHIKYVLETHRNEDYVVGSREILDRTDPVVCHADSQFNYRYGEGVLEGDEFNVGGFSIKAIKTPGHTPGSVSYLLHDRDGEPWCIFTGDALFADEVGRTDLLGDEMIEEMTGVLYESIFNKILPLGDEVIVFPAHGAGSPCGASISDRNWTTIGIERKKNPFLQVDGKESFIDKAGRKLEIPPYFRKMEELNLYPPVLKRIPTPTPLKPSEFIERPDGSQILDTRTELEYGSAHIKGSISIMSKNISKFAGWFLSYEKPILVVGEDIKKTVQKLVRMGFDNVHGYLAGGLLGWHTNGLPTYKINTLTVHELCQRLDQGEVNHILDVRSQGELEKNGVIEGSIHIHLTQLPEKMDSLPRDGELFIFCGSGIRSMTAASILSKNGFDEINVVLGGLAGWNSKTTDIIN